MKIKSERHHETRISATYKINEVTDRETALRWAVLASKQLPFEKMVIRVEDGESFHDGTISSVFSGLPNEDSFINEYINSEIYFVLVSGNYKGAHISVSVHLDLQQIYIGCEEDELNLAAEIEQLLDLV